MPGDPLQMASTAGVIAYNGENPRGWNDPPTFAFKSNKGERAKPKLDLRKRVSHQQALTGTPSGMAIPTTTQPQNFAYTTNNDITQGLSGLNMNSSQPSQVPFIAPSVSASTQQPFAVPPVTMATQPLMPVTMTTHQSVPATTGNPHSNGYMPAPSVPLFSSQNLTPQTSESGHLALHPIIKSVSVPSELMHVGEAPLTGKLTPPLNDNSSINNTSTNLGQPLCSLRTHSYEPVVPAHPLTIRSGADINNVQLDDSSPTETTPQIFNPAMPPTTVGAPHLENVHATFHHRSLSFPGPKHEHIHTPVGHITPPPRLQNAASGHATPPLPPPVSENTTTPVLFAVGHSTTPPPPAVNNTTNQAPFMVGQSATPPPPAAGTTATPPMSLSAGNTPKLLSPVSQHKKLSADDLEDFDDEEGLKKTMDAFQDVIDKYQDKLQKRVVDDIKKRLQVMSLSWQNGKLSKFVKARMIHLAEALDGGNSDEAHRMHVSIIVDHVSEVNQWMVGVKKLISVVSHSANGTVPYS